MSRTQQLVELYVSGIEGRGGQQSGYYLLLYFPVPAVRDHFFVDIKDGKPSEMAVWKDRENALFCFWLVCRIEIPVYTSVERDSFLPSICLFPLYSFILGELPCRKHSKLPCPAEPWLWGTLGDMRATHTSMIQTVAQKSECQVVIFVGMLHRTDGLLWVFWSLLL